MKVPGDHLARRCCGRCADEALFVVALRSQQRRVLPLFPWAAAKALGWGWVRRRQNGAAGAGRRRAEPFRQAIALWRGMLLFRNSDSAGGARLAREP